MMKKLLDFFRLDDVDDEKYLEEEAEKKRRKWNGKTVFGMVLALIALGSVAVFQHTKRDKDVQEEVISQKQVTKEDDKNVLL